MARKINLPDIHGPIAAATEPEKEALRAALGVGEATELSPDTLGDTLEEAVAENGVTLTGIANSTCDIIVASQDPGLLAVLARLADIDAGDRSAALGALGSGSDGTVLPGELWWSDALGNLRGWWFTPEGEAIAKANSYAEIRELLAQVTADSAASRNLALTDNGAILHLTHATPTLVVQNAATTAYPANFRVFVRTTNAMTLDAGTSVSINGEANGTNIAIPAEGSFTLYRTATNIWFTAEAGGTTGGGGGGSLDNVVEDTTPTLGGNLALGGFTVGAANDADLTKLHAVTASAAELNHTAGVTSAIQTQINAKQALHANLTAFAGLSLIADRLPYANGTGTLALATLTAAGRAILDDADATAQRATLALTYATVAEVWTGTATDRVLTVNVLQDALAPVAVADGATITIPAASGINFEVAALAGNRTLAASGLSSAIAGRTGTIRIVQDATGSRGLTPGTGIDVAGGTISIAQGASDETIIPYRINNAGTVMQLGSSSEDIS